VIKLLSLLWKIVAKVTRICEIFPNSTNPTWVATICQIAQKLLCKTPFAYTHTHIYVCVYIYISIYIYSGPCGWLVRGSGFQTLSLKLKRAKQKKKGHTYIYIDIYHVDVYIYIYLYLYIVRRADDWLGEAASKLWGLELKTKKTTDE